MRPASATVWPRPFKRLDERQLLEAVIGPP